MERLKGTPGPADLLSRQESREVPYMGRKEIACLELQPSESACWQRAHPEKRPWRVTRSAIFVPALLAALACSADPRPAELDLMIGDAELNALCGPGAGPLEIEAETLPLKMRKISTSYQDDDCGIALKYRLYTYSTADGARDKFRDYEATYDSLFEGLEKKAAEDGRMLQYARADGEGLVFLARGGTSLISGSVRSSGERVRQLRELIEESSTGLAQLSWSE